ncbi:MAG: RNA polymerase factor sigma-32 [Polyangiales bacterium]
MMEHDEDPPDEIDEPQDVEVLGDDPIHRESKEDALAASHSALSRRDPLGLYMRDVQRYPLLSKEEEHDLAVRYFEEDDLDAAKQLVTSNLRLVVKIAYDYRQAYKNILDLVQEGNIGLMQAVKKYDPYKGVKLSSYAAWWIRAYILRYILNNHRLVKVGTTQAQRKLFFNLQKEKARLSAMGIEPTAEIIAERLNVPERDVVSMDMRLAAGDASLDAPVGTSEGRSVARVELLPSDDVRVDDTLAEAQVGDQFTVKIHEFGKTLEGKEKKIFDDRLVSEDPKTLQVLGDEFGVSRERVRQIEKRLLKKLKEFLRDELGETVVEVYESP